MNILYIGMDNTNYGSRSHEVRVAETMANEGNNVTLMVERQPNFEGEKIPKKMRIFPMPLNTGSFLRTISGRYKKLTEDYFEPIKEIAKKEGFDVIFSSSASGAKLAQRFKREFKCKSIVQVLDIPTWLINSKNIKERIIYRYFWKRWIPYILFADKIIVNNNITKEDFPQSIKGMHIKFDKIPEIFVVNYGITTSLIDNIPKQKKKDQMIFVARLVKHKGIDLLIKAASKAKNPPKLVIVGSGNQRKKLVELTKKLGVNTEFKGALSDKEKIIEIKKSKFMIYTSLTEQIAGLSPIEALYSEIPCICFDLRILKELYGKYVDYVPSRNVDALAKKINELNKNEKYRLKKGREGRIFVMKKLTNETHAKQILKIMESITKKK